MAGTGHSLRFAAGLPLRPYLDPGGNSAGTMLNRCLFITQILACLADFVFNYAAVHRPQDFVVPSASGRLVNDPTYVCSDRPIHKVNDNRGLPVFMPADISQVTHFGDVKLYHTIIVKPSRVTSVTKYVKALPADFYSCG